MKLEFIKTHQEIITAFNNNKLCSYSGRGMEVGGMLTKKNILFFGIVFVTLNGDGF